jgi:RNA polymerase-binding transcription factor DksA
MAATPHRTDLDFAEFRGLLMEQRARILALHREQRADMLAEEGDAHNELSSSDYNEPGELGAMLADEGRDEAQDDNLKAELHAIDHALARMDEGTYGICEVTGQPIPVERLRDIPWATMTVEAAERIVA